MSALTYLLGNGPTASPLGVRISLFFARAVPRLRRRRSVFPGVARTRAASTRCKSRRSPRAPLFIRLLVTPAIGLLADRLGNYRLVIVTLAWARAGADRRAGLRRRLRADPRHRRRLPARQRHHAAADRDDGGRRRAHAGPRLRPHAAVGVDHLHHRQLRRRRRHRGAGRRLRPVADRLRRGVDHRRRARPAAAAGDARAAATAARVDWRTSSPARLLQSRLFILFLIAIGCTHGAHATFYTFGALHWQAQGLSAAWVGTLWAIGVLAEVVLFALSAPVVRRFGPAQLIVAGAGASVVRWGVMAFDPPLARAHPAAAAARADLRRGAPRRHPVHHARGAAQGHGQRAGVLCDDCRRPGARHRRADLGSAVRADRRRGVPGADGGGADRLRRRRHAAARLGRRRACGRTMRTRRRASPTAPAAAG